MTYLDDCTAYLCEAFALATARRIAQLAYIDPVAAKQQYEAHALTLSDDERESFDQMLALAAIDAR